MDPDIVNDPRYADLIDDALLAVPTIYDGDGSGQPLTGSQTVRMIYVNANAAKVSSGSVRAPLELINCPGRQRGIPDRRRRAVSAAAGAVGAVVQRHRSRHYLLSLSEYGTSHRLHYPLFGSEGVDEFAKIPICERPARTTPGVSKATRRLTAFVRDVWSCRDGWERYIQGQPYHAQSILTMFMHQWALLGALSNAS